MPVPPIIPTSFVPHPSISGGGRGSPLALVSVLTALAFFFFLLALVAAGGVFIYNNILVSEVNGKNAQLTTAESGLNQNTIEQFVRLRNRITSAETLLNNHVALSGLFDLLQTVTPEDADFSSVNISMDSQGNTTLTANGTARSFNSLAAASNDFSTNTDLENVIFSNLAITSNGSVTFVLSATLAPSLIAYTGTETTPTVPNSTVPSAPTSPTTASTSSTKTP